MPKIKAAFCTLGCKVNSYDSQAMRELIETKFDIVDFHELADVYIINTCTVTNLADKKSRQSINRAKKQNPHAIICVCGCLAQKDGEKLLDAGVDIVIGTSDRAKICDILLGAISGKNHINAVSSDLETFEPLSVKKSGEKTRGYIKISEGCNNFCTYCIIPYVRGPVRSRAIKDIQNEAMQLAQNSVREVVLTGIHISSYNFEGNTLIDAICAANVPGIDRIRLGSLEPSVLTEEFLSKASKISSLCPHFHVSLQSGSNGVLQRMGRKYTAEQYLQCIQNVRKYFDNPAITTDIITGFPGETEEEHAQTLEFIKKIEFSKIHVFPYSEREGTVAAKMPGSTPPSLRKSRAQEVSSIAEQLRTKYMSQFVNKLQQILLEQPLEEGFCMGHNERYIVARAQGQPNQIVTLKVSGYDENGLY